MRVVMMWNENLKVNNISYSPNHIVGSVMVDVEDILWFFTYIYGFPEEHNKRKTWELMSQLTKEVGDRWIFLWRF